MANIMDPDQTAPIGAVCSGFMLFASMLISSVMLGNIITFICFERPLVVKRHYVIYCQSYKVVRDR